MALSEIEKLQINSIATKMIMTSLGALVFGEIQNRDGTEVALSILDRLENRQLQALARNLNDSEDAAEAGRFADQVYKTFFGSIRDALLKTNQSKG